MVIAPKVPSPVMLTTTRLASSAPSAPRPPPTDWIRQGIRASYFLCFCGRKLHVMVAVSFPRRSPAWGSTKSVEAILAGRSHSKVRGMRAVFLMVVVRTEVAPTHVGLKNRCPPSCSTTPGRNPVPSKLSSSELAGELLSMHTNRSRYARLSAAVNLNATRENSCGPTTPLEGRHSKGPLACKTPPSKPPSVNSNLTGVSPLLTSATVW
mmetsp:Transcript_4654/g.15396  ORF Transcript_4654/g.15396 Transcript_4654/m.15396 type:complete len:209 (-) Transcript_4654:2490-3116(-)